MRKPSLLVARSQRSLVCSPLIAAVFVAACDGAHIEVPVRGVPAALDGAVAAEDVPETSNAGDGEVPRTRDDAGAEDDADAPDLDASDATTDTSQNGGWDGALPEPGSLRINEVDCEGDRVELVNVGSAAEELSVYAVADDLNALDHRTPLSGVLEPGAYTVITLEAFGLKCGVDNTFLLQGDTLLDVAAPLAVPAGATLGRLPDATGAFAANNATLGRANEAFVDQSEALFAAFETPVQITLVLDDANRAALRADPRSYVHAAATISAGGQTVGPIDIGVRLKGSFSFRNLDAKAAFKLDADRFVAGQSFFGLSKLTLNNLIQDPSTIHEWLAYQMFGAVDIAVPRVGYASVTVDGESFGTYLLLEDTTTSAFLRTHFASSSALYEPPASADVTPEQVVTYDVKQGNKSDFSALLAIANPLADGARETWYDAVGSKIYWPEVLRYMAVDLTNGNGDGYAIGRNNYMVHLDSAGALRIMPWGLDASFAATFEYFSSTGLLLARCFEEPRCVEQWLSALEDVQARGTAFFTPALIARARTLGQLNTARFASDTRWEHSASGIALQVDNTLSRLQQNFARLAERIACNRGGGYDADGDGRRCELDCDENNPTRYRGAPEVCGDQIDQDCNGVADDGAGCPACVAHPTRAGLVVCPRAMSMAALRTACTGLSAAPLTIESADENSQLANSLGPWFSTRRFFIGLSDEVTANTFVWNNGATSGYRNFVDGYPFPRVAGEGARCAIMSSSGSWRTEQCNNRAPGACEQ